MPSPRAASLLCLNKNTGDVVWNKQIADYKAGYSYTAAPLILNGMIITGNSGGEFGVAAGARTTVPRAIDNAGFEYGGAADRACQYCGGFRGCLLVRHRVR